MNVSKTEELSRLGNDNAPEPVPKGYLTSEILAHCPENAPVVLDRVKELLRTILNSELSFDDKVEDWKALLPEWFLQSCREELPDETVAAMLRTEAGRRELSQHWTVDGFLYWFSTENRYWWWWNGGFWDVSHLIIQVLVEGFPFPSDALAFLVQAAGATNFDECNDVVLRTNYSCDFCGQAITSLDWHSN